MITAVDNVVAIHGAPLSGTSWLGQLFNSSPHVAYRYQPFFSYAFRGRVDAHSDAAFLHAFFSDLLATEDAFVLQVGDARLAAATPHFVKNDISHLVYKEVRFHHLLPHLLDTLPRLKVIGIVRDPRAVLASWSRAPREFDPTWSLTEQWRDAPLKNAGLEENWYGYTRWKQLAQSFLSLESRHPHRFRLVRYEELVQRPAHALRTLFDFCGLEMTPQSRQFLADSTTLGDGDAYSVFRAHGDLRAIPIDPGIEACIAAELRGTPLQRFLCSRELA